MTPSTTPSRSRSPSNIIQTKKLGPKTGLTRNERLCLGLGIVGNLIFSMIFIWLMCSQTSKNGALFSAEPFPRFTMTHPEFAVTVPRVTMTQREFAVKVPKVTSTQLKSTYKAISLGGVTCTRLKFAAEGNPGRLVNKTEIKDLRATVQKLEKELERQRLTIEKSVIYGQMKKLEECQSKVENLEGIVLEKELRIAIEAFRRKYAKLRKTSKGFDWHDSGFDESRIQVEQAIKKATDEAYAE